MFGEKMYLYTCSFFIIFLSSHEHKSFHEEKSRKKNHFFSLRLNLYNTSSN